jgi:peptide/nickel transport system permease protein
VIAMTVRAVGGRLAGLAGTLLGVAVVVFVLLRLLPGDAIDAALGTQAGLLTGAQRTSLEKYYGIDQSIPHQFVTWIGQLLHGNLGVSVNSGTEVTTLLASAIPVTVELAVLATVIGAPLGVALGVLAAGRPGAARDIGVQSAGLLGLALPEFILASVTVAVLGAVFRYFPSAGIFVPLSQSVSGNLSQLIYPALVLAVGLAATVMRTTRSAYLDVARSDFVRTARGKGLFPRRIRGRHVLRNSSVPIVTMIGIQFGYLLGGTVVVEQVFALPGLGRLLLNAILQRDYAVVQSAVLLIAVGFVLVNLLVDLVYRALDPRTVRS